MTGINNVPGCFSSSLDEVVETPADWVGFRSRQPLLDTDLRPLYLLHQGFWWKVSEDCTAGILMEC